MFPFHFSSHSFFKILSSSFIFIFRIWFILIIPVFPFFFLLLYFYNFCYCYFVYSLFFYFFTISLSLSFQVSSPFSFSVSLSKFLHTFSIPLSSFSFFLLSCLFSESLYIIYSFCLSFSKTVFLTLIFVFFSLSLFIPFHSHFSPLSLTYCHSLLSLSLIQILSFFHFLSHSPLSSLSLTSFNFSLSLSLSLKTFIAIKLVSWFLWCEIVFSWIYCHSNQMLGKSALLISFAYSALPPASLSVLHPFIFVIELWGW